ncbi:MAG: iron uptake transporter permease EfeU [Microbacteriaceae bacterium]
MFANYLIGLREGLEAGLIVGILVAYAVKAGRRDVLPKLWAGVGIAIVIMLAIGALLTWGPYGLSFQAQEIIGGLMSILAVGLVTWMVFWMNHHAAEMAGELRGKLDNAMAGTGLGIVIVALVSVAREGIETALFVWANVASQANGGLAALGALLGILTAVALSWLIYRGLIKVNLRKFFGWTGAFLIFVAAGVLAYGIGDLTEAGVLPHAEPLYSLGSLLPASSLIGSLLAGIFNFNPEPTLLQFAAWWSYLLVVGGLFIGQLRRHSKAIAAHRAHTNTTSTENSTEHVTTH